MRRAPVLLLAPMGQAMSIASLTFRSRPRPRSAVARAATLVTAIALLTITTGCRQQPAADVPRQAAQASPVPKADARLTVANNNGRYHYAGVVADETTRAALLRSLQSVYGGDAEGAIEIDPDTRPAPWSERLDELLLAFRVPGGMLELRGGRIELSGAVPDESRALLLQKARELYPGLSLTGLFEGADADHAVPRARRAADLATFLNGIPIAFQADSGLVSAGSLGELDRAARAIKRASVGIRLQIGVRPERSDMPGYDRRIAFQRANSVKVQLAIRGVSPGRLDAVVLDEVAADRAGQLEFAVAATPVTMAAGADRPPAQDSPAAP